MSWLRQFTAKQPLSKLKAGGDLASSRQGAGDGPSPEEAAQGCLSTCRAMTARTPFNSMQEMRSKTPGEPPGGDGQTYGTVGEHGSTLLLMEL